MRRGLEHFAVRRSNPDVARMMQSQSDIDAQLREDAVKIDEEIELLRAPEQAVDPAKLKDAQVQVGLLKVDLEKEKASSKPKESTKHIGKGKIGDSTATVELRAYPDRAWGNIYITPRPDGGEPISKVRSSDRGAVRQRMQKAFLARDYIYFMVASDAFSTYLEARRIAEVDHNSPVGWEFTNQDLRIYKGLSSVRFEHTPPPPPKPDPNPKPKPKPPGKPNVLD